MFENLKVVIRICGNINYGVELIVTPKKGKNNIVHGGGFWSGWFTWWQWWFFRAHTWKHIFKGQNQICLVLSIFSNLCFLQFSLYYYYTVQFSYVLQLIITAFFLLSDKVLVWPSYCLWERLVECWNFFTVIIIGIIVDSFFLFSYL